MLRPKSPLASLDAILLSPIVFTPPIRLVAPTNWTAHIPFALWLVNALRPGTFVELGTHSGTSYSAFAQAIQIVGDDASCYAVDTWEGDSQTGFYGTDVFEDWSEFHGRHFGAFSRLVRSTFDNASTMFADRSIDLLHIDGLHTYDAVRHDFDTWLPKMSERGVVLLHDINVRERDFGVWRLWGEMEECYPTLAFIHSHGLGVAGIGPNLPPSVKWLVTELPQRPDDVTLVRRFFAALGGGLDLAVQLQHERETGTSLADRLAVASSHEAQLEERATQLEGTVAALQATLATIQATRSWRWTESLRRVSAWTKGTTSASRKG